VIALARVVLRKELRDGLRDRRTVAMALFFPLLGPVVLGFALGAVSSRARTVDVSGVVLPIVGREHAPNLVAALEAAGVAAAPAPADPEAAVRAGDADAVLIISPEFGERLRDGRPAPVRLVVDRSRQPAHAAIERVQDALSGWSRRTAVQRLVARGIHPAVAAPLAIEEEDLATPQSRAAMVLSILPYFLVLAIFIGGMSVAIDATAGERERGSLEPLLVNPVPRSALVLGKIGAAAFFSALAFLEAAIAFSVLPVFLPTAQLGLALRVDPGVMARIAVLCAPLLLLASTLMVLVAARARSFKAAQTTLSFLSMVPALPGVFLALSPVRLPPWAKAVPAIGEQLAILRLLRGEAVPLGDALLAMAASSALALVLFAAAVRFFERGTPLFDR
jgi:sodium transport system permease protein